MPGTWHVLDEGWFVVTWPWTVVRAHSWQVSFTRGLASSFHESSASHSWCCPEQAASSWEGVREGAQSTERHVESGDVPAVC